MPKVAPVLESLAQPDRLVQRVREAVSERQVPKASPRSEPLAQLAGVARQVRRGRLEQWVPKGPLGR